MFKRKPATQPRKVLVTYGTLCGADVEVYEKRYDMYRWTCKGCDSNHTHLSSEWAARKNAEEHASKCRAKPKAGVSVVVTRG